MILLEKDKNTWRISLLFATLFTVEKSDFEWFVTIDNFKFIQQKKKTLLENFNWWTGL